jgi:hypothetical protein
MNYKIEEKKAPTDESIRLLNEFHKESINNIVSKVELKNNIVEATIIIFKNPLSIDGYKYRVLMIINGNKFEIEDFIGYDLLQKSITFRDEKKDVLNIVFKSMSNFIAQEMLKTSQDTLSDFLIKTI